VQTPRFCGEDSSAGAVLRTLSGLRGLAINWLIVGIVASLLSFGPDRPGFVLGFRPAFPRAKRNRAIRLKRGGALSFLDDHDAIKRRRRFTLKSDSGCQWQRLSFIRRGDAPAKL
jgi:hypothetical protein